MRIFAAFATGAEAGCEFHRTVIDADVDARTSRFGMSPRILASRVGQAEAAVPSAAAITATKSKIFMRWHLSSNVYGNTQTIKVVRLLSRSGAPATGIYPGLCNLLRPSV